MFINVPFLLLLSFHINSSQRFSCIGVLGRERQLAASRSSVPEYVVQEDDDDEEIEAMLDDDTFVTHLGTQSTDPLDAQDLDSPASVDFTPKLQFASLTSGAVTQVQVGDISLARKAWKKRRRSGSPLLVPCSVLRVDRACQVRWNLVYLLEKFGSTVAKGVKMNVADLCGRHRKHLQSSLTQQSERLGEESVEALVKRLFPKSIQDSYGVRLQTDDNEGLYLYAPFSRMKAQKRAAKAAILQFVDSEDDVHHLQHTGLIRQRGDDGEYALTSLSAALRVSQEDVEQGLIENGSTHAAVIFEYDLTGDAGSPLLVLSLNPNTPSDRFKGTTTPAAHELISNPRYNYHELSGGQGPLKGKVVRMVKGGVLVDCGVGRHRSNMAAATKVLGTLSFRDAVVGKDTDVKLEQDYENGMDAVLSDVLEEFEEDEDVELNLASRLGAAFDDFEEDEVEDITHLFETADDGSLLMRDQVTGDLANLEESFTTKLTDVSREDQPEIPEPSTSQRVTRQSKSRPQWLTVGDTVSVFIKSVSKQNSQLQFTLDSTVQGRKARDLKKEGEAEKRLSRLSKQMGGIRQIDELKGLEGDATVKAVSKAGNWYYVEPSATEFANLPVGIGTRTNDNETTLEPGTKVRIKIDGIDEARGQLAFSILSVL